VSILEERTLNTDIKLHMENDVCIPSVTSVQINAGDTITFSIVDGPLCFRFFSPDTLEVFSPQPPQHAPVGLGKATYTFVAPGNQAYGVVVQGEDALPPERFDFGAPQNPPALIIQSGLPPILKDRRS
jgi:hypothetical protein